MPIKVQGDLPAKAVIESENIFIMDETRAIMQDIRPLKIAVLNLMPIKHDTEIQLLRALSNTPLQVDITFVCVESHISKNTPASHLNQFYSKFSEIKNQKFDGLIITGAPVEQMPFEEVNYWDELKEIMDWSDKNVTSTIPAGVHLPDFITVMELIKYLWIKKCLEFLNIVYYTEKFL